MFDEMADYAERKSYKLSVYVDDITMSGSGVSWTDLQQLHYLVRRHGLTGHKSKISRRGVPRLITGVMINGEELQLPFARWKKIKIQIKTLKSLRDPAEVDSALNRLVSTLYEASQVDPRCRKMAEFYHQELRGLRKRQLKADYNSGAHL